MSTIRPLSPATRASLEEAVAAYEKNLDAAMDYLAGRGITRETAEDFRLGVVGGSNGEEIPAGHNNLAGRLAIPSLRNERRLYGIRFRAIPEGEPKYLGLPGVPTRLFNIRAIHDTYEPYILVTEGELDCIIASQCGLPAVGVVGANNWKKHHPRMLAGFQTVYVCGDGDDAGRKFSAQVAESLPQAIVVSMPDGMDVNDLYLKEGREGVRALIGVD